MTFREKFPKDQYPLSSGLYKFIDHHPDFFCSLKLVDAERFKFIPLIFTSHTPKEHSKHKDEIIGMWYFDTKITMCERHDKVCHFKQDFIVNINKKDTEFISYSTDNCNGEYVKPIKDFFKIYGENGKYYHNGKGWQHHYADISDLPNEPDLKTWAKKIQIICRDVQGEFDKLKACYDKINRGLTEPDMGIYSDCYLLHTRNLIDFLTNKKSKNNKDDVLITHFIRNGIYFKREEILPPNKKLNDPYGRINKQLSHITYSRLDPDQYNFFGGDKYYETIFQNIKDKIEGYNKNVRNNSFKLRN